MPTSTGLEVFAISLGSAALAEIEDTTQILVLALALHFRRIVPILCGSFLAGLLNHLAAAFAGQEAISVIDKAWAPWLLFALLLSLAIRALIPPQDRAANIDGPASAFVASLVLVFVAELGAKTQIATILLAAKYGAPVAVASGTTLGMLLTDVLVVLVGTSIAYRLSLRALRWASAMAFLGLGLTGLGLTGLGLGGLGLTGLRLW